MIPIDILPVFKSPAVQTLTFYGGMSANSIANDITNRMERWTGQANGTARQESRSIIGASIVRNYFQGDVDPNGALTQVNSLSLAVIPNLPPGTLPPVVLPFDPTATTPVCVVAVDSDDPANNESVLYDVGRYEVRNMIMGQPGAVAPVVYGGKIRAVMAYLDRQKMQARRPLAAGRDEGAGRRQRLLAHRRRQVRRPRLRASTPTRCTRRSRTWATSRCGSSRATPPTCATWPLPRTPTTSRPTSCGSTASGRSTSRSTASSGPARCAVVSNLRDSLKEMEGKLTRTGINLKLVMDQSVYVRKSIEALVQEGLLGAILCSLVILMFLGEWRMTAIAIMTLPISIMACVGRPLLHGPDDQRDDAGRHDAGDRADDRQRHHLPGEHAPAPGHGRDAARGGVPGGQRGGHARAGLDALHVPGALAAGLDARPGPVPVQADGDGGRVLDDRRLLPVADPGAGLCRRSGSSRTRPWPRRATMAGHGTDRWPCSRAAHDGVRDVSDQRQRQRPRPRGRLSRGPSLAGSR